MTAEAPTSTPPSDPDIRVALLQRLRAAHACQEDTAFIEELGLCRGRVRVDVAVVNGVFHGYEIKSDRDSLRRLAGQIDLYGRVLDRATLVVGAGHVDGAVALLPVWWEVQVVYGSAARPKLKRLRAGRKNPSRDARALVELLWSQEALGLVEARGGRGDATEVHPSAGDAPVSVGDLGDGAVADVVAEVVEAAVSDVEAGDDEFRHWGARG